MAGDPALDARNADFWNELCGTTLARSVGVTGRTPDDLARFDRAFLDFYPYLLGYVPARLDGVRVLEIGLGYGTLGSVLVERGATYTGVDLASGPVDMMRHRIDLAARAGACAARQASVLDLPFGRADFDLVYSIGCIHHTGDLSLAVNEIHRVLRAGGAACVMVYNRWSARRVLRAPFEGLRRLRRRRSDRLRAAYDTDSTGRAAPHTDFVSAHEARRLFSEFHDVRVDRRNLSVAYLPSARRLALSTHIDRLVGLDLYVRAVA